MQRKYDCQSLDIHSFFEVIETLSKKIYQPKAAVSEEDTEVSTSEGLELFL